VSLRHLPNCTQKIWQVYTVVQSAINRFSVSSVNARLEWELRAFERAVSFLRTISANQRDASGWHPIRKPDASEEQALHTDRLIDTV